MPGKRKNLCKKDEHHDQAIVNKLILAKVLIELIKALIELINKLIE